jgi:hypothetical protein
MAMPARAVCDKTFEAGGSGRCSLLFEGTHYEKSIEAMPGARMTMQPARMSRTSGSSIYSDQMLIAVPPPPYRQTSYCFLKGQTAGADAGATKSPSQIGAGAKS